ncbi:hypothetical protein F5883DRAFT_157497 [Diaporthe sp. PMI_573]|nr:hypothetical protein F5883DRAFT_157497 [Diaporthaceae sp. PMI_573]
MPGEGVLPIVNGRVTLGIKGKASKGRSSVWERLHTSVSRLTISCQAFSPASGYKKAQSPVNKRPSRHLRIRVLQPLPTPDLSEEQPTYHLLLACNFTMATLNNTTSPTPLIPTQISVLDFFIPGSTSILAAIELILATNSYFCPIFLFMLLVFLGKHICRYL